MTDASKALIGVVPTIMAAGLVKHNLDWMASKKKKRSILNQGMNTLVGVSLIQATAQAGSW